MFVIRVVWQPVHLLAAAVWPLVFSHVPDDLVRLPVLDWSACKLGRNQGRHSVMMQP